MHSLSELPDPISRIRQGQEPSGHSCEKCGCGLSRREFDGGWCGACRKAEDDAEEAAQAQARRRHRQENFVDVVLRPAGVPERFRECTRAAWKGPWPSQLDAWMAEAELSRRGNVLIKGAVGTGKTHLATALLIAHGRATDDDGMSWFDASDFIERLKAEFDRPNESRVMAEAVKATLLVLDEVRCDLTADKSGWRLERISHLVRQRWNHQLPTVVTTNLALADLERADPHLFSRLASGVVITTTGKDRRLVKS